MPDSMSILAEAGKLRTPNVVQQLRAEKLQGTGWTLEQLQTLYMCLATSAPLDETAEAVDKSPTEVVDEIARFGSWIRQGRKVIGVNVVFIDEFRSKNTPHQGHLLQAPVVPKGTNLVKSDAIDELVAREVERLRLREDLPRTTPRLKNALPSQLRGASNDESVNPTINLFGDVEGAADQQARSKKPAQAGKSRKQAVKTKTYGTRKESNGLVTELGFTDVIIGDGFRPTRLNGRDITKAAAAIIVAQPSRETIVRYLQRTTEREKMLTYEHVSLVWLFSRLGRLDDLGEINQGSAALAHCFADAYDLLEVTRSEAMRALHTLCQVDVTVDEARDAVVRLRPLAETHAERVDRVLQRAELSGSSEALANELVWLRRQVDLSPYSFVCSDVSSMRAGQIMRCAQHAGLHTGGSSRVEEAEIRSRLEMLGLANEADRLVPTGVAATRQGLDDTFWEAVERRADGDPKWDSELLVAMRRR
jgi:hypothetical protein